MLNIRTTAMEVVKAAIKRAELFETISIDDAAIEMANAIAKEERMDERTWGEFFRNIILYLPED